VAIPAPDPALAAEQGEQARLAAPAGLAGLARLVGLARLAGLAGLADALPATARVRIPQSCLLRTPWPLRAG